jgi:hypothetical protein
MAEVHHEAFEAIRSAYEKETPYLLIGHGWSTSRPFHVTAQSMIRRLMRSKEVTPYVDRRRCVQHPACFLVALKPLQGHRQETSPVEVRRVRSSSSSLNHR